MNDSFFPDEPKMIKSAVLSPCGKYRYSLKRVWDESKRMLSWICLNPSTADAESEDNSSRRMINFTRSWGYGGLVLGNAFAYRATNPKELLTAADPVGPDNNDHLKQLKGDIIVAWGASVPFDRDQTVCGLLARRNLYCLGVTKKGYPRHPLYAPSSSKLTMYRDALGVFEHGVPK